MSRSYKKFNPDVLNNTLKMELHSFGNNNSYKLFQEKFLHLLNKQMPLKN